MLCDIIHHLIFMDTQDQTAVLTDQSYGSVGGTRGARRDHGVWVLVLDHVVDTLSLWTFSEPTRFMDFVCVLIHNLSVLNRKICFRC